MTEKNGLHELKTFAKRYARANRIALHQALDLVAGELGFSHWVDLSAAGKKGWQASPEQRADIEAFVTLPAANPGNDHLAAMAGNFSHTENADHGMIGAHTYSIQVVLHDVIMAGEGWCINIPENPGALPIIETYSAPDVDCAVRDPEFLQAALTLARKRANDVRAEISTDWSRRSTKPDKDGVVRHPLGHGQSEVWFCLGCDSRITGARIALNLWHCPGCGASPLNIFDTAFWSDDEGRSFPAPELTGEVDGDTDIQIVDARLRLDFDKEKIILLIRSALLDDAANVSEKLGALQADIDVDEDNGVCVTLEMDLWPEGKDSVQASEVAGLLGLEIDFVSSWSKIPFAWPRLGEITASTSEYTAIMLEAYSRQGGPPDGKDRVS